MLDEVLFIFLLLSIAFYELLFILLHGPLIKADHLRRFVALLPLGLAGGFLVHYAKACCLVHDLGLLGAQCTVTEGKLHLLRQ